MKKEEKGRRGNIKKKQEDTFSDTDTELSNDEYGFEYNFFITKNNNIEKKISSVKHKKQEKGEDTQDQSKAFFLPDFFTHED
ncbi:MAG: hypothetical protein HGA49_12900 [Eubacteriaceae bacterium]|nr:hypothetical protein [Eubacteriaceae bacterium]